MIGGAPLPPLITDIVGQLQTENSMLRDGRLTDALALSEQRVVAVEKLERVLKTDNRPIKEALRPMIEQLAQLNMENAALLQAAIAGQAAAKSIVTEAARPAGYNVDGTRVFPVTETKSRRF